MDKNALGNGTHEDVLTVRPLKGETVGQAFGRAYRQEMARRILEGTPSDGMAIITSGIRGLVANRIVAQNAQNLDDHGDEGIHVEIDTHGDRGLNGNFDGGSDLGSNTEDAGVDGSSDHGSTDVSDDVDHYGDDSCDGVDSDPGM